jgi:glutamate-1-semialdehyde 2,1-aminomutase
MAAAGVEAQVPVVGPLVGLFFGSEPVTDYDGAKRSADTGEYARFFHGMLDRGVAFAPGPYEIFFPSLAHGTAEIDATIEAAVAVAATLAPAG